MKWRLAAITLGMMWPLCAQAEPTARPLTKAERTVCTTLDQCLSIVKRHPHDSFDYETLADAFERFGARGRRGLLRLMARDDEARGHAADLLAAMGNGEALPELQRRAADGDALAARTVAAIEARLNGEARRRPVRMRPRFRNAPTPCPFGEPIDLTQGARQMPFFETQIAYPDAYGAYRPSARFTLDKSGAQRGFLSSALSIEGGWLAAYWGGADGGLVRYDNTDGRPTVLIDAPIIAILPHRSPRPGRIAERSWAISEDGQRTTLWDNQSPAAKIVATLPGRLTSLSRTDDGTVQVTSSARTTVQLRPDGRVANGCAGALMP